MLPILDEIYRTHQTLNAEGIPIRLTSSVRPEGGLFLHGLATQIQAAKTLEVGLAMGLSTVHLCEAIKRTPAARHYAIDPFQVPDWQGAGLKLLERTGLRDLVEWVPVRSEVALPSLLKEHEGTFDLIFVDGWHSFDHVLVDSFYALRLLRVGGVLVLDDCHLSGIAKVVACLKRYDCLQLLSTHTDYPEQRWLRSLCQVARFAPVSINMRYRLPKTLRKLIRWPNIVAFKKIAADNRPWDWYRPF